MSQIAIFLLSITIVILSCLGCSKSGLAGRQIEALGLPTESTCPDFFKSTAITVRGGIVSIVSPEGSVGRSILNIEHRINSIALHPLSSQVAYVEESPGRSSFRLKMRDSIDQSDKVLFASDELIHSVSWAPDGRKVAFLVGGYTSATDWLPQHLYIMSVEANCELDTRDCGRVTIGAPKLLDPDQMAPQIVWSLDENNLLWVGSDKKVKRLSIASGKKETLCPAQRIFAVTERGMVIARDNPWRIIQVSADGRETVVAVLPRVEAVGIGTMIPKSEIITVVVRERQPRKHMKNPWMPTLFVNLKSGNICGRVGKPIMGYYRSSVTSRPSPALDAK